MDILIFIGVIYAVIAIAIKVSKAPQKKTVVKVIKEKAPRQEKPIPVPDCDEIEYQRGRLNDLYELYELIDERITNAKNSKEREQLIRKIINIDAQIRRAQKIISKEYAKAS